MKDVNEVYRYLVVSINYKNELSYYISLLESKGFNTEYLCTDDWEDSELQVAVKRVQGVWYAHMVHQCTPDYPNYTKPPTGADWCNKDIFKSVINNLL